MVQHIKVTMSLVDKSLDSLVVWRGWNPLIAFHFLLHSRFFHVFLMFCIDWTSTYTQIHARIHIQCKSNFGHRKKEKKIQITKQKTIERLQAKSNVTSLSLKLYCFVYFISNNNNKCFCDADFMMLNRMKIAFNEIGCGPLFCNNKSSYLMWLWQNTKPFCKHIASFQKSVTIEMNV